MKPVPIKSVFSLENVIRRTIADFEEVIQNHFDTPDGKRNRQIVFPFNYTLFEAALLDEKNADSVIFSVLKGIADPKSANAEGVELEGLLSVLPRRIKVLFPNFFDFFVMQHVFGRTIEGKQILRIWFERIEKN